MLKFAFDSLTKGTYQLTQTPNGLDGLVIADLARLRASKHPGLPLIHVASDDQRLSQLREMLRFFAPNIRTIEIPAWDCLPYDRVSPSIPVATRRLSGLIRLARLAQHDTPSSGELLQNESQEGIVHIVLTTINAALQRVPPLQELSHWYWQCLPGQRVDMAELTAWLIAHGYERSASVRDPASFAVRGGIIDIFPAGYGAPVRLDFFGDTLESIRSFNAATQRSESQLKSLEIVPVCEASLDAESISRFRTGYRQRFGTIGDEDILYASVSDGRRIAGMEHWLPLFHRELTPLLSYVPGAAVSLDPLIDVASIDRIAQIEDYYQARRAHATPDKPYRGLEPSALYLDHTAWNNGLENRPVFAINPFNPAGDTAFNHPMGGEISHQFTAERANVAQNLFDAVADYLRSVIAQRKKAVLACWSQGSRERLIEMLADHGLDSLRPVSSWVEALGLAPGLIPVVIFRLEDGFRHDQLEVITEQDILGKKMVHPRRARRVSQEFLTEATSLAEGDLLVHVDHGIGRFTGLRTITAAGAPHDCVELVYAGDGRLLLPVENIELLSRYGGSDSSVALDRLGGVAWQARKAKLKKHIAAMAAELLKTAAARALKPATKLFPLSGEYEEFCARFGFVETDDQMEAIDAVLADMASGSPMDRLICGDVGFGKTEIALRAAFVAALSGKQVAVVAPTTLLARQHYITFAERFRGLPIKLGLLSRLVSARDQARVKAGLSSGDIDIVIGTHAVLANSVGFADLGLIIIDEEQHFGVTHKEKLKKLRTEVHVLTLSATPIPRTLQLALAGVRDLSLIATPPVDRLAVRTFVTPYDPISIKDALLRERFRGGQSFYVCPRISDLDEVAAFLREHVPEIQFAMAHGQMSATALDDIMTRFYEGEVSCLLSTNIVESGLDIPTANTLIVHRADKFGLAQLYQLRGRVGRSKLRGYALLTIPAQAALTPAAEKRLKILQSLDQLGAGFSLASHDLDMRGAGNLLGDEQSGHVKEVGYELYQHMLEEAIADLKDHHETIDDWSPQIAVGAAILIPDDYVPDLELRIALYRRLARLEGLDELDAFAAELVDRFGSLPAEAKQLVQVTRIKQLCKQAGIDRLDAGPKGVMIGFKGDHFADPAALINFIADEGRNAEVKSDHRLLLRRDWPDIPSRLKELAKLLTTVADLARQKAA